MKATILGLILLLCVFSGNAQVMDAPRDGVYDKIHTQNRKPVPYPNIREADVFWSKRVWRVIDFREKINHPFYYPTQPTQGRINLISVLLQGIQEGGVLAYKVDDDEFKIPMTQQEMQNILVKMDSSKVIDPFTGEERDTVIPIKFDPSTVTLLRVKEDWVFDKQRSVIECRIIGICPVLEEYDSDGSLKGTKPLFWIYFPQARPYLVTNEVYNRFNDGQRFSFDDLFFKRMFSSYVIKESNVYDRYIQQYTTGLDALLESDRIQNDLFILEHDLWEF